MTLRERRLNWISSNGGPLVLISKNILSDWSGIDVEPSEFIDENDHLLDLARTFQYSDYERACRIDNYIGLLEVGKETVLILGDEPLMTTWISDKDFSGTNFMIRWIYADDENSILQLIPTLSYLDKVVSDIFFKVEEQLYLFDSAYPGREMDEYITVDLPLGLYEVSTEIYKPNSRVALLVHRFTILDG